VDEDVVGVRPKFLRDWSFRDDVLPFGIEAYAELSLEDRNKVKDAKPSLRTVKFCGVVDKSLVISLGFVLDAARGVIEPAEEFRNGKGLGAGKAQRANEIHHGDIERSEKFVGRLAEVGSGAAMAFDAVGISPRGSSFVMASLPLGRLAHSEHSLRRNQSAKLGHSQRRAVNSIDASMVQDTAKWARVRKTRGARLCASNTHHQSEARR
jgi:hypothetical protein